MSTRKFLLLFVALAVIFGTTQANASDRFFEIKVKLIAGGLSPFFESPDTPGPNCYSFLGDGTWIDPLFLNAVGTWVPEESPGMVECYAAMADWGGIPNVLPPLLVVTGGPGDTDYRQWKGAAASLLDPV